MKPTFVKGRLVPFDSDHQNSVGKTFGIFMALLCVACIIGGVVIMYKRQMIPRKFNVSLKFQNTNANNVDGGNIKMSLPKASSTTRFNEIFVKSNNDTSVEVNELEMLQTMFVVFRVISIKFNFNYIIRYH